MLNLQEYILESASVKQNLASNTDLISNLHRAIDLCKECFKNGNKILIAGNGGSAADAQHFAAEFVGRYKKERKGYPALALTTDTSCLTAWANDYDYETVFSRQVEALGKSGDIFVGISTSGNSKNILRAIEKAKNLGLHTVAILGKDGGIIKNIADITLLVPSNNTPRIQEAHIMLIHIICEEVEKDLS